MKALAQPIVFLLFFGFIGCGHPISKRLRQGLDPSLTFEKIFETPEEYIGKRVMLGGAVVETRVLPDGTEIEVVQKEIGFSGYPESGNKTGGRFIFFHKDFLEPEIYSKGRGITGIGKIRGTRTGKVGQRPYEFPVVEAEELKLFDDINRGPYFYPPYWDPWYRPNAYAPYWPFYQ